MKLLFVISRFSNLFVFIKKAKKRQSDFQDLWRLLTAEEHGEVLFYGKDKKVILEQWGRAVGDQNKKQFKRAFRSASALFAPQWQEIKKHLDAWKKYFKKNEKLLYQVLSAIEKINGLKKFDYKSIPIYLVSVPGGSAHDLGAWFSWTPNESFIVVEIPIKLKTPNNFFPLGIVSHEFFHLMFRKNKKLFSEMINEAEKSKKLLTKKAKGMPYEIFLEELLVSSFIPEGYMSERFLEIPVSKKSTKRPDDLFDWRRYIAATMREIVKEYSDNKKRIDKVCLKKIVREIKNPLPAF